MKPLFPVEILKEIFSYLTLPELRNSQLVCKSWYFPSHAYLTDDIKINMYDGDFHKLLNDLEQFPSFASKVNHLNLQPNCTGNEDPIQFRSMINLCTHLQELQFESTRVYNYLKVLNSRETKLPCISKMQLKNLAHSPPAIKRQLVWINFRSRHTITHLELYDLENIGALKTYDTLVSFVSNFPNLTYLEAHCSRGRINTESVNIASLLESNKVLKVLKLYEFNQITINQDSTDQVLTPYTTLTKLNLFFHQTSIDVLQYIMDKFKESSLTSFRLVVILPLASHPTLNRVRDQAILDNFAQFHSTFKKVNVAFSYKSQPFNIDRGNRIVASPGNKFFFHLDAPQDIMQDFIQQQAFEDDNDLMQDFLEQQAFEDDNDLMQDFLEQQAFEDNDDLMQDFLEQQDFEDDDFPPDDDFFPPDDNDIWPPEDDDFPPEDDFFPPEEDFPPDDEFLPPEEDDMWPLELDQENIWDTPEDLIQYEDFPEGIM